MRPAGAAGFTMIEIMIVITIVAILTVVGLPQMRDMVKNQRVRSTSLDLYSSLALARSEAIKRNASTVYMKAATGGWQNGWTVCFDANADGDCNDTSATPPDLVLLQQDPVDTGITLTEAGGNTTVTFSRDGRASPAISFRIVGVANSRTVPMRCVELDVSGRPRSRADSNGVDSDGCN